MNLKKQLSAVLAGFLVLFLLFGCAAKNTARQDIYIVYTNDIHSYIANETADDEGNKTPALRLSKISQMVKDMRSEGKEVLLVDAGDVIQGNTYGAFDSGESMIDLMNAAGYQLATPGNHEFDYGSDRFFQLRKKAKYPYISCNFKPIDPSVAKNELDSTKIFKIGNAKVAFVGISTPETVSSTSTYFFQNQDKNFIYAFYGIGNYEEFYSTVQDAIDSVRDSADYVIAIGHLGVGDESKREKISSEDVIRNTKGLDAFIDGHSHTTMECNLVPDKEGKQIPLTQTGSYLNAVGLMTIEADGKISSALIKDYPSADPKVAKMENKIIKKIADQFGKQIAVLENKLCINDPENENQRFVRSREMNIGDFVADAYYWYVNEEEKMDCDIILQNAGGIRTFIKDGDVLMNDVKNALPFGNRVCLLKATGKQVLDALEKGATVIGQWDNVLNIPAENGGFLQVAGMKYTIDASIPTSVLLDEKGLFKEVAGPYKVKDVQVYNKKTGEYEPLDLDKTYQVAGVRFMLKENGDGFTMFADSEELACFEGVDCALVSLYIESFKKQEKYPLIKTENSVLYNYKGYQIDYENPFGANRITIINASR